MNVLDKVALRWLSGRMKGLNPNQSNAGIIPVNSVTIQGYKSDSFVKAYSSSVGLFSVLNLLIRKACTIPWYDYKLKPGTEAKVNLNRYRTKTKTAGAVTSGTIDQIMSERKAAYDDNMIVEGSALAKRLAKPSENQTQDEFFENCLGYMLTSGEANIWGNTGDPKDTESEFAEILVLPTQFVDDYNDPNDLYGLLGYRLSVGSGMNIAKENLVRWKNWHPDFDQADRIHMRGISPVEIAWRTYLMELEGGNSMANTLKNGGARGAFSPAPVGNMPTKWTKEQIDLALQEIWKWSKGNKNNGNIGLLGTPVDYHNFGLSPVDMDIIKVMDLTLHQWCRVFGVPTVLFDSEHTSDNNYQNAMRDLVSNTVVPMLSRLRDKLNGFMTPRYGVEGKSWIDFDISALPELQRDMEKMVGWITKAWMLSPNQQLELMGYEPSADPLMNEIYIPGNLKKLSDVGMDLSPLPNDPNVQY